MKAVVFTLGCRVNQYESDVMVGSLQKAGYDVSDQLEYADIYILNTCAVTKEAERKSRQLVARAKKYNKNAKIFLCGCASEKNVKQFADMGVEFVCGTKNKWAILDILGVKRHIPLTKRRQAYVNIQDGCDNFCTYCVIPYLRGDSRSRQIAEVVDEVKALERTNQEIILTGINIAKYGLDIGCTLKDLVDNLRDVKLPIGIGSFYVEGITEELMLSLSNLRAFIPHFHLSLQTGDDQELRDMGRKYTTDEYFQKVQLIRKYFSDAVITTDIIVGFPTETDDSHKNTLDFIKKVGFSDIHIFVFSKREGTKAYDMPSLSPKVVEERRQQLAQLKIKLQGDN